jgi:hypothetical protein
VPFLLSILDIKIRLDNVLLNQLVK